MIKIYGNDNLVNIIVKKTTQEKGGIWNPIVKYVNNTSKYKLFGIGVGGGMAAVLVYKGVAWFVNKIKKKKQKKDPNELMDIQDETVDPMM